MLHAVVPTIAAAVPDSQRVLAMAEWDEKVSNLHPLDFQSSALDRISYRPIVMAQFLDTPLAPYPPCARRVMSPWINEMDSLGLEPKNFRL